MLVMTKTDKVKREPQTALLTAQCLAAKLPTRKQDTEGKIPSEVRSWSEWMGWDKTESTQRPL